MRLLQSPIVIFHGRPPQIESVQKYKKLCNQNIIKLIGFFPGISSKILIHKGYTFNPVQFSLHHLPKELAIKQVQLTVRPGLITVKIQQTGNINTLWR